MIRDLTGVFQPAAEGAEAGEIGVDRPGGQPGPGSLPLGRGQEKSVALQELVLKISGSRPAREPGPTSEKNM